MRYFENLEKTSENRLVQRSFYIPTGEASYNLLNGTWRFFYQKDGDKISGDTKISRFDKVEVPSCWQTTGYDTPNYTNINYPFPLDPPFVPQVNPVGVYEREFTVLDKSKRIYMVFEGISSCGTVFINGKYVGFTQGSHLQAEFDITDFVVSGKNTVRVLVRKWCCGSYLEDQDFFRMNGIFRDVYTLERPVGHIKDISFYTENSGEIYITTDTDTTVTVYDGTKKVCEGITDQNGKLVLKVNSPKLWNAEEPNLYRLEFLKAGEIISQYAGFRTITVSKNKEILINGTPVKFKGVNHHDSTLLGGYVMSDEDIIKDLTLMKELNINCIRTSHYPPSPRFLEYCDKMGFYICLETDIETHGFLQRNGSCIYSFDIENGFWPCSEKVYEKEFLERMYRAYHRDKNHASIFMWSVGNESGYGENTKKMVEFLHREDPRRLVHAEDASRAWARWDSKIEDAEKAIKLAAAKGEDQTAAKESLEKILKNLETAKLEHKDIDVYSRMYPRIEKCERWAQEDSDIDFPIFHCELPHFRGNAPATVWDYTELVYKFKKFTGFCLWEWCDHAVLKDGVLCYGGDFEGEQVNNGPYCCDGVVFADRTLKPASLEVKVAFAPFRFNYKDSVITVENRHDFLNLNNFNITYTLASDGVVIKQETLCVDCPAGKTVEINTNTCLPTAFRYANTVDLSLYTKSGKEIATLQQADKATVCCETANSDAGLTLEEQDDFVVANGKNFTYKFCKYTGNLASMKVNGKELLAEPVKLTAFRSFHDCEAGAATRWVREEKGNIWAGENLDCEIIRVYDTIVKDNNVTFNASIAGVARTPYFRYNLSISVFENGEMEFDLKGDIKAPCYWLPRLGFDFTLKKKNCSFEYFGNGPTQSYIDCNKASYLGWYQSCAKDEYVNFIVPQEHGNHINVRELNVDNTLFFKSQNEFECNLSLYSPKQLFKALHINELGESKATHLRIDYKNSGYTAASYGAAPPESVALTEKQINFTFRLGI